MKDKYSQGFPENFGEDSRESSHDSLVSFLKQNKPIAPPPAPNFEQQLFAEIHKHPQRSAKSSKAYLRRWLPWTLLIPTAIATGITFNWATNRSQYQVANIPNISQGKLISEDDQVAIEQSLINSWNATDITGLQAANTSTTTSDTQLLMELSPLEYE
ncbi:hypothetical protein B9G53_12960 [Pseudanabaena sp. SR411]|uniref:hypothetical protein n=1 Tax=Pseudanabaena sp. SR411 TaxID=1980935 RepID=UPI000B996DDA|nr:hypothetical protein [Pseudanabaena sp. SR411]OYQ64176.1 hypothetical protein B9G53_12960 [Pseudanabaena sp. SR411]